MSSKAIYAAIAMGLTSCSSIPADQALELEAVIADPARYDGQRIVVAACINVIIHGVSLLPCGKELPNVDIVEPNAGGGDFSRLVNYAHMHMGDSPEELPVFVRGQFHSVGADETKRHSIAVEQFEPRH
jgi:hypothetical protein